MKNFKNISNKSSKIKSNLIKEINDFWENYKENRTLDRKAIENMTDLKEKKVDKYEKWFSFMLSNEINYLSEILFQVSNIKLTKLNWIYDSLFL